MNAAIMSHCGDGCHSGCLITDRMLMKCQNEGTAAGERKICINKQRCAVSVCVFSLDQSGVKN